MEASKFIKESIRMCSQYNCGECPAGGYPCITDVDGLTDDDKVLEKYIATVEKWSNEHPLKTNAKKIEEVFGHKISTFFRDYASGFLDEKVFRDELKRWLGEEYKDVDKE